jgi:hypothetical protein
MQLCIVVSESISVTIRFSKTNHGLQPAPQQSSRLHVWVNADGMVETSSQSRNDSNDNMGSKGSFKKKLSSSRVNVFGQNI